MTEVIKWCAQNGMDSAQPRAKLFQIGMDAAWPRAKLFRIFT